MNCKTCGKELKKGQAFCTGCGTPVPPAPRKNPLVLPVILLCLVLLLSAAGNVFLLLTAQKEEPKFEGEGFASPEEAITAYAEAMSAGDVKAMLSTFAIESFVERYDVEERAEALRSYMPYQNETALPENGEYVYQVNVYSHLTALIPQIRNGYYTLIGMEESVPAYRIQKDDADGTLKKLMKQLKFDGFDETLAKMEIGDVLDVDDFDCDEGMLERIYQNYSYMNLDELQDLAIEVTFDGEDFCLFMLTAEIDGKWYNITPMSPMAIMQSLASTSGGIMERE